jgi:hypothetical protein
VVDCTSSVSKFWLRVVPTGSPTSSRVSQPGDTGLGQSDAHCGDHVFYQTRRRPLLDGLTSEYNSLFDRTWSP